MFMFYRDYLENKIKMSIFVLKLNVANLDCFRFIN